MTHTSQSPPRFKVIDADTHLSEAHDLWTSRAPSRLRDQVPHVVKREDGELVWVFDGDRILSEPAGAANSVRRDGSKKSLWEYTMGPTMSAEEAHEASHDPSARVDLMNEQGIWAEVLYPNLLTFGVGHLARTDQGLANLIVTIYNDAMAEVQEQSGGHLFPMAVVPFWDVEACVKEAERASRELDLRGIAICSEPHASGFGDLANRAWDPLWEACTELSLPINLHAGATELGMDAYTTQVWPSMDKYRRHTIGAMNVELHQSRVFVNLLSCGLLERFPETKWVFVESGVGWIPYVLERLEFHLGESLPENAGMSIVSPLELFRRQVYTTFWFEEIGPSRLLDFVGFGNVMFETDFPHPVCKYPSAADHALSVLEPWGAEAQRAVMQENASSLYRIAV